MKDSISFFYLVCLQIIILGLELNYNYIQTIPKQKYDFLRELGTGYKAEALLLQSPIITEFNNMKTTSTSKNYISNNHNCFESICVCVLVLLYAIAFLGQETLHSVGLVTLFPNCLC